MVVSILQQITLGQAPSLVPLSVQQYHDMIAQGILREGDAIELIDGLLVRKDQADRGGDPMSHGPRHASGVKRLQRTFHNLEVYGCHLQSQLPITLANDQEPEPDGAVVRGLPAEYDQRLPGPKDIIGVMEVSDSSLIFDRTTKQRLYATAVIAVFWIVNLTDMQVEVYEHPNPADGTYAKRTDYCVGQTLQLTLAPGLVIDVAVTELLPA